MTIQKSNIPFLKAFDLDKDLPSPPVISVIGAGGKTSLIFELATEAKLQGKKVLITTTTKMRIPEENQYDFLDVSGRLFPNLTPLDTKPGIYMGGSLAQDIGKMSGVENSLIDATLHYFDIILIEADGAASKSLKGWKDDEPVIHPKTTHTIGVVDFSSLGKKIDKSLVHRLDLFTKITHSKEGEEVTVEHLYHLIHDDRGLFSKSFGKRIVYFNKIENDQDLLKYDDIKAKLNTLNVVGGSIKMRKIYDASS